MSDPHDRRLDLVAEVVDHEEEVARVVEPACYERESRGQHIHIHAMRFSDPN
jgi:hypothetical protein